MRFLAKWFEDAPNAAPEERATACDLQLWINDRNVCLHVDGIDGQLYDHVTMPLYSVVEGLTHDWWVIFGGRDREYRLIKHRMGYTAPDVRFRYDGAAFEAYACQYNYTNPDIRFWSVPNETMNRGDAEAVLSAIIYECIDRLHQKGSSRTSAELRWARVQASRSDPDEAVFCEAAGALDIDPYAASDEETDLLLRSADLFAGEPLLEFLAGAGYHNLRQGVLSWISQAESRPAYQSRLHELAGLAKQVANTQPAGSCEPGWALGYRRARATRAALDLNLNGRVSNVSELARTLGNKSFRRAAAVVGLRALISMRQENVHVHLRDRPPTPEARVSELFAFARAMGDAICFPNTPRSVVNELHEAERQATGRAFAAEFLAPIDEILSMRGDGKEITTIADEMNVSTEVVDRQLENQHRIREVFG